MKVTANTPDLLILKHAALPNPLVPSAFARLCMALCMALCTALGFRESVAVGVFALGVGTLEVWLAARGLEQVRVVFDKTLGHVGQRRHTRLHNAHEAQFEPDEITRVEVEETRARGSDASTHPLYKLILMIPKGTNAGRHPLTLAGIRDHHLPGLAKNIAHWLKRT